ncbi:hypothetical protein AOR_1_2932174 [Paecilomyces variotii No. 5]|uniref:Uncharacterized protein n=1 Tax=Byssochlamys spectabilis (strain No. 5 / NBRC 109023) TaxID=1356009 RepID=V5GFB8_BYSSN|nr:hypothetical protein AOR_1_2932174 [Paecilomyces variotii No. 5]
MDPFGRLPWFALRDVLSQLPDLPTLHALSLASPAMAAFLREDGSFSNIVESIISNPQREKGLYVPIQWFVRAIVLVWWRKQSIISSKERTEGRGKCHERGPISRYRHHHRDENPLTRSFPNLMDCLKYNPRDKIIIPPSTRTLRGTQEPLPRNVPPAVLCRLLKVSTRVHQITHAFFHAMIRNCMNATNMKHLPPDQDPDDGNGRFWCKTSYWCDGPVVEPSRRPRGIRHKPYDIGAPTWFEEQRLLYTVWRIVLFFVLQDGIDSVPDLFLMPDRKVHFLSPKSEDIARFWLKEGNSSGIQMEQLRCVLSWLDNQAGGEDKIKSWIFSASLPDSLGYCCPKYTAVSKQQWDSFEKEPVKMLYSPGYSYIQGCLLHSRSSPLVGARSSFWYRYGVVFWDSARLSALGFPGLHEGAEAMWFAWSSVLKEDEWETVIKVQRQRYDHERSRLETFPRRR